MSKIPALRGLRQVELNLKTSLELVGELTLKNKIKQNKKDKK
jgi:hypothetical protein